MKLFKRIIFWIILVLFIILFSPIIILGFLLYFIFIILPSPIERRIYYKSKYYEDFNKKYTFGITYELKYKFYNRFNNTLGFKVYNIDNNKDIVIENENKIIILYTIESEFYYDKEKESWTVFFEYDEYENFKNEEYENFKNEEYTLDEMIHMILNDLNIDYSNKKICIALAKSELERDLKMALKDPNFIIYKNYKHLFSILEKELLN